MKKSGGLNKNLKYGFKNISMIFIAIFIFAFSAFSGISTEKISQINMPNKFDSNKKLGLKTKDEHSNGITTLSLTVDGDSVKNANHVNVIVILDRSGSMADDSGTSVEQYVETSSNSDEQYYGLIDGEYVALEHRTSGFIFTTHTYYYNGEVYTGRRFVIRSVRQNRMQAAKTAVNKLANSLLSKNGGDNPADSVEMALVSFASTASTDIAKTTSYETFSNAVNGLVANGGTNWEDALLEAKSINFEDNDPTYVIFVTDGAPTFYNGSNGETAGNGQEQTNNMNRSYNAAKDDAAALAQKVGKNNFYTIFAYGETFGATYLRNLTVNSDAANAPAKNNYSAANTAALQAAFDEILNKIELSGIGYVSIEDGTTNNISSELPALLEIVPNSFKYWKTDPTKNNGERVEWTSNDEVAPPAATNDNGTIKWNLSELGVLENNVTYEVTFDVYPSQYTFDLIADLKNDPSKWDDVDDEIKKYLHKDGDNYYLDTNTSATLKYKDTRLSEDDENYNKEMTYNYDNPEPVITKVSKITLTKEWDNDLDSRDKESLSLNLYRGEEIVEEISLGDGSWTNSKNIATGLLLTNSDGSITVLDKGHDYSLKEPTGLSYYWELDSEIVHPMLIDGVLTTLVKVEGQDIPSAMGENSFYHDEDNNRKFYRIDGNIYLVKNEGAANLIVTNYRKSNVNVLKTVTGDGFDDDQFIFNYKVTNVGDDYVWFTVYDTINNELVLDTSITNALDGTKFVPTKPGEVVGTPGSFYVANGEEFYVKVKNGWNLRLFNLGTGSTYEVEEVIDSPYVLKDVSAKTIVTSTRSLPIGAVKVEGENKYSYYVGTGSNRVQIFYTEKTDSNGETYYEFEYTPKVNNKKVVGEVVAPNTSYNIEYQNDYPETHLEVEKEFIGEEKDVVVTLYKSTDGVNYEEVSKGGLTNPVTLNNSNDWKHLFEHLDVTDSDNNVYSYFVLESPISGNYVATYDSSEDIVITAKNVEDGLLEVSANIIIDGNSETVVIKKSNGWKFVKEDVNFVNEDGTLKNIRVEKVNDDSDASIEYLFNDKHIKITNEEVVNISGEKTWSDGSNQDGLRPDSITVTLTATVKEVNPETGLEEDTRVYTYNKIVTENEGKWSWNWENLPKYKDGKLITYTLSESQVSGYTTVISGYDIENIHEPSTVDINGSKTWVDGPDGIDQDGVRPESIDVTLIGKVEVLDDNGEALTDEEGKKIYKNVSSDTKTITADDNWSWEWLDQPEYNNGQLIIYEVVEAPVSEYTTTVNGYDITNTHELQTVDVAGSKSWDDAEDENGNTQDGVRPESIDITLTATVRGINEETGLEDDIVIKTYNKTVTASDNWSWEWLKLPKNYQGKPIKYSITEGEVQYYTAEYNGYSIINHHNPFKSSLVVIKHWDDNDDQDGIRPKSVQFILKADGVAITDVITLSEDNDWTYINNDLPRRAAGSEIEYTITEIAVEGYQQTKSDVKVVTEETQDKAISIDVYNNHKPEEVHVAGSKTWDDDNDRDGMRPDSITITLNSKVEVLDEEGAPVLDEEGNKTYTIISSEEKTIYPDDDNNWSWDFGNLAKYYQGQEIFYEIIEEPVEGYTYEQSGYNLINSHGVAKTSVSGIKKWDDDNDREGNRPLSVTITLYANGEPVDTTTANIDSNWEFSFSDLPLNEDGNKITYTVGEDEEAGDVPEGYTSEVKTTAQNNYFEVWNHYEEYESTEITVKKIWNDDNDRDGVRPTTIYVNVYDKDNMDKPVKEHVAITGTIDNPNWAFIISELPKYKNHGELIQYVVDEVDVANGYTSEIAADGLTITNTIETKKVTVPVTKTWIDGSNKYGYRSPVTVKLVANDKDTGYSVELNENNNWSYTFGLSEDEVLPMNEKHGNPINYKVVETTQLPEYEEPSYPAPGVIVNQIKNLYQKEIPIKKVWDDNLNQDGKRPTSITIDLIGTIPGNEPGTTITAHTDTLVLTGDMTGEEWTGSFVNAPIFFNGTEVTYTVTETLPYNASEYPESVIVKDGEGFKFTNKHEIIKIDIPVTKVWDDEDDNDGKRPNAITIALIGKIEILDEEGNPILDEEGKKTYKTISNETVTISPFESEDDSVKLASLNDAGNWNYTFTSVPKYNSGQEIVYEVAEIGEYDKYNLLDINGYIITNQHKPETITYQVAKSWDDYDNQDGVRPDSITVYLTPSIKVVAEDGTVSYEPIGEAYSQVITEGEDGEWTYSFEGLSKYSEGRLIQYILTEKGVELYTTQDIKVVETLEDSDNLENIIENHHDRTPHEDITVNKYWDDEDDKYKKRPNSVTVQLLANGEVLQTAELSDANDWSYTFTDLWMYDEGVEIIYSVKELNVEYYESSINGFDITNKYNGPIPEITPPNTGVRMVSASKKDNVLIEMILTLLSTSYTVVVLKKRNN